MKYFLYSLAKKFIFLKIFYKKHLQNILIVYFQKIFLQKLYKNIKSTFLYNYILRKLYFYNDKKIFIYYY